MKQNGRLCAAIFLLAALLLGAVGCGSTETLPSESISSGEGSYAESVSFGTTTSTGTISLLPDGRWEVRSDLWFSLPDGWTEQETVVTGEVLSVTSSDGLCTVSAVRSELSAMTGVTAELLIEEMRGSLTAAWKEAGAAEVSASEETVSFLGAEMSALLLTATLNGQAVFQKQLYLLDSDGLLTLTVTTRGTDNTQACLDFFSEA